MQEKLDLLLELLSRDTKNAPALYVPISGGSDSALALWLLNQVAPDRTVGLHFYSTTRGARIGDLEGCWFNSIGRIELFDVGECYGDFDEVVWQRALSLSLGRRPGFFPTPGWLVSCRNKTEDLLGTYSMASRVAGFMPIVDIWKSEVLELCHLVGVPGEVIASSSKADPDCGRPAEMSEIPVKVIDEWLKAGGPNGPVESPYLDRICKHNAFKATLPYKVRLP